MRLLAFIANQLVLAFVALADCALGAAKGLNYWGLPRFVFGSSPARVLRTPHFRINPVVMMDGHSIPDLQNRLLELNSDAQSLQAKADDEKRELTAEEQKDLDAILNEFDHVEQQIERRQRILDQADRLAQPGTRQTPPVVDDDDDEAPRAPANAPRARSPRVQLVEDPRNRERWGWNHMGEFAQAVRLAGRAGGQVDNRLAVRMAPSTYGSEGIGEDGGFAVPPEFRRAIMEKVLGEDQLIARTDGLESSSNAIVLPTDETTPWQTSGGIQAYWEDEAGQIGQSKPNLKSNNIRLNKLTALVGVTEELLEDAPAMDAYLRKKAPQKINFKINRAIVAGTGAGQPLGLLNSPAKIAVAAEGSQAADTIVFENLTKMWSRMYSECWKNSVWLANQDIMPQLLNLNFISTDVTGATAFGGTPVYLPPGGLSASPYGMLLGRPVIYTEACETLGDEGDLILADLTQYLTATKIGGIRAETSMHLWFDYDMQAFRFILRVAGQPWWSSAISPRSGSSNSLSCIVTLAARAG